MKRAKLLFHLPTDRSGNRGFPDPRRPEEDDGTEAARLDPATQGSVGSEDVPLSNKFIEGFRADLGGERLGTVLLSLGEKVVFHRGEDVG
jgi:hypothetical protein